MAGDYTVVTGTSPEQLTNEVKKKLGQGWELQGGVAVSSQVIITDGKSEVKPSYAQALFRATTRPY
jgi:hypothetical protein